MADDYHNIDNAVEAGAAVKEFTVNHQQKRKWKMMKSRKKRKKVHPRNEFQSANWNYTAIL